MDQSERINKLDHNSLFVMGQHNYHLCASADVTKISVLLVFLTAERYLPATYHSYATQYSKCLERT